MTSLSRRKGPPFLPAMGRLMRTCRTSRSPARDLFLWRRARGRAEHGQARFRVAQRRPRRPGRVVPAGGPRQCLELFPYQFDRRRQADGNLIISGRNTWAFYKVQRHTGKMLWRSEVRRATSSWGKVLDSPSSTMCAVTADGSLRCSTTKEARRRKPPSREVSSCQWTRNRSGPPGPAILKFPSCAVRGIGERPDPERWEQVCGLGGLGTSPSTALRAGRSLMPTWPRGPPLTGLSSKRGRASRPRHRPPSPSLPEASEATV